MQVTSKLSINLNFLMLVGVSRFLAALSFMTLAARQGLVVDSWHVGARAAIRTFKNISFLAWLIKIPIIYDPKTSEDSIKI